MGRGGVGGERGRCQTRLSRIQERLKRPLVVARAKRQYALLESLRAGGRGVRSPPRNNAKEERNEEETGNPDERAHAPEFTPAGCAPAGTGALRTPGLRRGGRAVVPSACVLGCFLSEVAAREIVLVASQVCGVVAEGRSVPRPGRRRRRGGGGGLGLAGGARG